MAETRSDTMPSDADTRESFYPAALLVDIGDAKRDPFDNVRIKRCIAKLNQLDKDNSVKYTNDPSISEGIFLHRHDLIIADLKLMWQYHINHLQCVYGDYEVRIVHSGMRMPFKPGDVVYVDPFGEVIKVQDNPLGPTK